MKNWPMWKREALKLEERTGKFTCGSVYWEAAMDSVAEAARLPAGWSGNWEPLSHWLRGNGEQAPRILEEIVAAIGKKTCRPNYEPPHSSLAYFNDVVWAYGGDGSRRRW